MTGGKEFTESLTGFDNIWLEPGISKGFWVKSSDISDFKYTTYFFAVSDKFKKSKYKLWIETRWGLNSMVQSDEQIANVDYFYQKNYPKDTGNAKDK
jgi:hypothetical protein